MERTLLRYVEIIAYRTAVLLCDVARWAHKYRCANCGHYVERRWN